VGSQDQAGRKSCGLFRCIAFARIRSQLKAIETASKENRFLNFLLDTNLISEWIKPEPNTGVVTWTAEADEDRLFISVVTLAELRHGIDSLAAGRRRDRLDSWLQRDLPNRFEDRILLVTPDVADRWGRIVTKCEAVGRPIGVMDAFIAATADIYQLAVVTRNESDFESSAVSVVNPWSS
jgi:predicted nucleic acid-binding protein